MDFYGVTPHKSITDEAASIQPIVRQFVLFEPGGNVTFNIDYFCHFCTLQWPNFMQKLEKNTGWSMGYLKMDQEKQTDGRPDHRQRTPLDKLGFKISL